jgi:hypothetical protein
MECRLVYSIVPYQGNFEEQAIVYVKRLLWHQKAARWKKEKSRRVRPSTVCLKKEGARLNGRSGPEQLAKRTKLLILLYVLAMVNRSVESKARLRNLCNGEK